MGEVILMPSILFTLYQHYGQKSLSPSVELDTVWQLLGELETRQPDEKPALLATQEYLLSAVKRAEAEGFSVGFRTAMLLWWECDQAASS